MWLKCLETDGVSECGFDYGNMSRKEIHDEKLVEQLAWHYKEILKLIGEDPGREGLKKTPIRAAKALIDITAGSCEHIAKGYLLALRKPDGYRARH